MTNWDYERSHPWITFQFDLAKASPPFWMLLGEARSKCDHIRFVPLSAETAGRLHALYLARGINATTAIEGNTLTEAEVRERVAGSLELPPSKEYLGVEVDNMVRAYNRIVAEAAEGDSTPITLELLCELNRRILEGLDTEPHVVPGEVRKYDVRAGPYLAVPWGDVAHLLSRLCEWLGSFTIAVDPQRIPLGFVKAVIAHVYLEWIHPFGDGNGRLGRLVEFLILIRSGVPLPAAHVLTSHYNDTRTAYYRQLQAASRSGGDLHPFLMYAAQGFVDGLTGAVKHLHAQQEQLMWQALVEDSLEGMHTPASRRQRLLAVELGRSGDWVLRSDARHLTPSLAEMFAGRTTKTLTRDINRLVEVGLLESERTRIRADLTQVRGMRPFVVEA